VRPDDFGARGDAPASCLQLVEPIGDGPWSIAVSAASIKRTLGPSVGLPIMAVGERPSRFIRSNVPWTDPPPVSLPIPAWSSGANPKITENLIQDVLRSVTPCAYPRSMRTHTGIPLRPGTSWFLARTTTERAGNTAVMVIALAASDVG